MGYNQKTKRVQLIINQVNNYLLLGIVSAEPDYKLSLSLNNKFSIFLKNTTPVEVSDANQSMLVFSRFSDTSGSPDLLYNLISNRSGKQFLFKKLKNIDYIFQIQDSESEINISKITESLREIETVNAVFNIDIDTLKDKNLRYLTL
jgi:hypothetical protein